MKKIVVAAFAVLLSIVFSQTACYYDNEVDQYGTTPCDTANVSYSQVIKPIIDQNCISCHAPGGERETSPFTTYDEVVLYAESAVPRINGSSTLMPPSGKMSSCNIALFTSWVNAGAPNN